MRALLLAAGFGTRLKPLTDMIPKCLVPINGTPLLEIWLERLSSAGIREYLVNTHYLADQVEDYIAHSKYKSLIKIVNEPNLLGTAGTLIANIDFFQGEDGMLVHADNYCLADLGAFQKAHFDRPKECLMTMMTFRSDDPHSCGIVELNQSGTVIGFHEKVTNPPGNLANGAVYILSAELLKKMSTNFHGAKDFSTEVLNRCVGNIYSYETSEIFIDIGTPKSYAEANIC